MYNPLPGLGHRGIRWVIPNQISVKSPSDNLCHGKVFFLAPFFQLVLLTLGNPREKFWGAILALTVQGLSLSGIELGSFEDLLSMIKAGDPPAFGVVFFPMHRIERVGLDLSDGQIPSLSQRFTAKTGLDPSLILTRRLPQISTRADL